MSPEDLEKVRIYHAVIRGKIDLHRKWGEGFASIEIEMLRFIMLKLEQEQTLNEQMAKYTIHYYTSQLGSGDSLEK
jgi:hypothetical protein